MKYLFVVQGEGRGHFTQTLSMKALLERNGHEVVAVMVGCSPRRTLPCFFTEKINAELIRFQSPNFMPTPKGKGSPLLVSILYNLLLLPVYIQSVFKIRQTIRETQADVVVNFYELLCGITYGVFKPETPMMNVAHQYYFLTPAFEYTGSNAVQFKLLNFYSRLTALNATKIMALSFREEPTMRYGKIVLVPPLLRNEVLNKKPTQGDYIHGYLLNNGYIDELIDWSIDHINEQLHFFWDNIDEDEEILIPNLTMHQLSDTLFLDYMAGCKAYATTGGFESVCEAIYLQKPVLMVPTHIEQECNVIDAMRSGVGVSALEFDLNLLLDFVPTYTKSMEFRYWVKTADSLFVYELTKIYPQHSEILIAL